MGCRLGRSSMSLISTSKVVYFACVTQDQQRGEKPVDKGMKKGAPRGAPSFKTGEKLLRYDLYFNASNYAVKEVDLDLGLTQFFDVLGHNNGVAVKRDVGRGTDGVHDVGLGY